MQDHAVVRADQGVFLATSWRMPPSLTAMDSPQLASGISSSVANVERLNRLCRLLNAVQR